MEEERGDALVSVKKYDAFLSLSLSICFSFRERGLESKGRPHYSKQIPANEERRRKQRQQSKRHANRKWRPTPSAKTRYSTEQNRTESAHLPPPPPPQHQLRGDREWSHGATRLSVLGRYVEWKKLNKQQRATVIPVHRKAAEFRLQSETGEVGWQWLASFISATSPIRPFSGARTCASLLPGNRNG